MKLFFNILNFAVFGVIAAVAALMGTIEEADTGIMLVLGVVVAMCALGASFFWRLINWTSEQRGERARKIEYKHNKGGVHILWWIFWLIVFFPALIVVAIIHSNKKTRAAIQEANMR